MALIDKASLLFVPSVVAEGKAFNILPSGNRAPDSTDQNSGYDQTRADFDFDRGSNAAATRVNASGLIEKYRENLLTYSNDFSNAAWSKTNLSLTANQTDPNGGANAFLFTSTSASNNLFVQSLSNQNKVCSIYAKAGNRSIFAIVNNAYGNGATFDLSAETAISAGQGSLAVIESVGNDWFRCSVYFSLGTQFLVVLSDVNGNGYSNGDTISFFGAQMESSLVATDYLESTSVTGKAGVLVDLPRINYDANGENGALLLEPSRQNLVPFSEYYGGSGWDASAYPVTITSNSIISPDGNSNATLITPTSGNSRHAIREISISAVSGATYTLSVFFKKGGSRYVVFGDGGDTLWRLVTADLDNGVITDESNASGTITPFANGWYRITCQITRGNSGLIYFLIGASETDSNSTLPSFNNTSLTTYSWGAQVESNATYATSYIPTMGTSETRAADSCSVTGVSDVIGQTEGTIYLDIQTPDAIQSNTTFSIGGGTSSEYAQIEIRTDLSINWRYRVGGTDYINANVGSYSAGDRLKIAFGYKNADSILYLNGSSAATDTGSIVSNSWDEVKYSNFADTGKLEASVYETILFNERLSNAELATLTTL